MKKNIVILIEIVCVLLIGTLIFFVTLFYKNNNEKSKNNNLEKNENVTTTKTDLIDFYDNEGYIIGSGTVDENGNISITDYSKTFTEVTCHYLNEKGEYGIYEDEYTFFYSNRNVIYDTNHIYTSKYYNYMSLDDEGNHVELPTVVDDSGKEFAYIKITSGPSVYNPDNLKFNSVDEYIEYLLKHYNECKKKSNK